MAHKSRINRVPIPQRFYYGAVYALSVLFLSTGSDAFAAKSAPGGKPESGGLPQLDPSTYSSQLFWLAVAFIILYLFFANKTLPEISGTLDNRREHIENDLETADKLKAEAEAAHKAYEDSLANARADAAALNAKVHQEIQDLTRKKNAVFIEKSENEINALESRLKKATDEAMDEMNTIAAEVASEAAHKIVGISTDLNQAKTVVQSLSKNKKEAA